TYELAKLTWNNCDCDHSEATDLFMYGLKRVVKHIEEHKNHVGWEYNVSRGKLLIKLGERVYSDYYALLPFCGISTSVDADSIDWFEKWFNSNIPSRDEIDAAQKKQEKARRIYYKLLEHRLEWLWD
ncbi:MAG TPA: hypothetical protein VGK47_06160, partial [Nitrososphaeraceae archaeon]